MQIKFIESIIYEQNTLTELNTVIQQIIENKTQNLLYYKITTELYLMTNKLAMKIETKKKHDYYLLKKKKTNQMARIFASMFFNFPSHRFCVYQSGISAMDSACQLIQTSDHCTSLCILFFLLAHSSLMPIQFDDILSIHLNNRI